MRRALLVRQRPNAQESLVVRGIIGPEPPALFVPRMMDKDSAAAKSNLRHYGSQLVDGLKGSENAK